MQRLLTYLACYLTVISHIAHRVRVAGQPQRCESSSGSYRCPVTCREGQEAHKQGELKRLRHHLLLPPCETQNLQQQHQARNRAPSSECVFQLHAAMPTH